MNCRDSALAWLSTSYPLSLRCAALAERTGYTPSGLNTVLHSLVLNGLVERLGTRGHYRFRAIPQPAPENPVPLTTDEVIALAPETLEICKTLQHSLSRHSEGGKKVTKAEARALLRLTLRLASNLVRDILD